jgi:NADH-quinone oxidoreductase subunit K
MTCEIASLCLLIMGCLGMAMRRRHVLQLLMCMELALLAVVLNFVAMSARLQNLHGHIVGLFILAIAAAETVIALAVLVVYQQQKGDIHVESLHDLHEEPNT